MVGSLKSTSFKKLHGIGVNRFGSLLPTSNPRKRLVPEFATQKSVTTVIQGGGMRGPQQSKSDRSDFETSKYRLTSGREH